MKIITVTMVIFGYFLAFGASAADVQWNPVRNLVLLDSKTGASASKDAGKRTWPQIIDMQPMCDGNKVDHGIICHGEVLIQGESKPEHIYCVGSLDGCPDPSTCLSMYKNSQGSASSKTLVPLVSGTKLQTANQF